jgi:hypothetical protein
MSKNIGAGRLPPFILTRVTNRVTASHRFVTGRCERPTSNAELSILNEGQWREGQGGISRYIVTTRINIRSNECFIRYICRHNPEHVRYSGAGDAENSKSKLQNSVKIQSSRFKKALAHERQKNLTARSQSHRKRDFLQKHAKVTKPGIFTADFADYTDNGKRFFIFVLSAPICSRRLSESAKSMVKMLFPCLQNFSPACGENAVNR